jgi:hypothetical protein
MNFDFNRGLGGLKSLEALVVRTAMYKVLMSFSPDDL